MSSCAPRSSSPRSKRSSSGARALLAGAVALALAPACSSDPPTPAPSDTVIAVGVQSDALGPDAKSARVTATVDGQTVADQVISAVQGNPAITFEPTLVKVAAPAGKQNARVEVKVDVLAAEGSAALRGPPAPVLLTRLASAQFVPGATRLLRVRLEQRCVNVSVSPGSPALGPTCQAPQTCIAGRCADSAVGPMDLEALTPTWPTDAPDACKPANAGPPEVIVGSGQTDYMPLAEGATLQMELGPQRGRHIWIAVRTKNIKQSGSTTTLSAVQPGTGVTPLPTAFVFTFDRDEGSYCKLYGLRFQLDAGNVDYKQFLGKPLEVTVEVGEPNGRKTSAKKTVNIDTKVLGE
jgi:hypothetical protein